MGGGRWEVWQQNMYIGGLMVFNIYFNNAMNCTSAIMYKLKCNVNVINMEGSAEYKSPATGNHDEY